MTDINNILKNKPTTFNEIKKNLKKNNITDIFCEQSLDFCYKLSTILLNDKKTKGFPSLQALGFWLRKANISKIIKENIITIKNTQRTALGVVFQIPPKNVDILFGYNVLLSILCGNITIVRLWNERTEEQDCLLHFMGEALSDNKEIKKRLLFLAYDRNDKITKDLSSICDIRMVWGGDETVQNIRKIPLPPLSKEINFGDRFSSAIIKTESFLNADNKVKEKITTDFAKDLFSFKQKACTSPRIIFWTGNKEKVRKASEIFYNKLTNHISEKIEEGDSISKNNYKFLALHDLNIEKIEETSDDLTILYLNSMDNFNLFKNESFGNGMLFHYYIDDLNLLNNYAQNKDQTLCHWGFNKNEIDIISTKGFDRYVPFGQTLNFDVIWDGYNLLEEMTKLIRIVKWNLFS